MTKARSSRSGPLTSGLPLASSLIFAETRSQVQKPTHKDLKPMLRFLNAPAHALLLQAFAVLARIGLVYD
ncbi:hypothetical protein DMC16_14520 [Lacticaseibacillus paracasei]|jgi:hypothetical protein|nr:hypothetical protein DMC16_14520 [Lacticaseibacillus paracasei]